jgi:hypothetical protein
MLQALILSAGRMDVGKYGRLLALCQKENHVFITLHSLKTSSTVYVSVYSAAHRDNR